MKKNDIKNMEAACLNVLIFNIKTNFASQILKRCQKVAQSLEFKQLLEIISGERELNSKDTLDTVSSWFRRLEKNFGTIQIP